MERRSAARNSIPMDVLIRYDLSYPRIWKTRDLSTGGAFISTRYADLAPDLSVEAVLVLKYKGQYEPHRISCRVVRVDADGFAVEFRDCGQRVHSALLEMLGES